MIKKGITRRPHKGIVDVICDRCLKSVKIKSFFGETNLTYYGTLSISGGYDSPCLPDGITTTAHLCEPCWVESRKALEAIGVKFVDEEYL